MSALRRAIAYALALIPVTSAVLLAQGGPVDKLYVGARGGLGLIGGDVTAVAFGGDLFAVGEFGALSLSVETLDFGAGPRASIGNPDSPSGETTVFWTRGTRIESLLYALFSQSQFDFYGGAGFSINRITNAQPVSASVSGLELATALEQIEALDDKILAVFGGGVQWRLNRFAAFAEYRLAPASGSYLKDGTQNSWIFGARYELLPHPVRP